MDISIFEVVGPVMLGPSSSHTAGMARIGRMAGNIIGGTPKKIKLTFHPALRCIYDKRKTDVAIIGGVLGIKEDDEAIRESRAIAAERNIEITEGFFPTADQNPNMIKITVTTEDATTSVTGISVGGGSFVISEVDGNAVNFNSSSNYLFVNYKNRETQEKIEKALASNNVFLENKDDSGIIKLRNGYLFWLRFIDDLPEKLVQDLDGLKDISNARITPSILAIGLSRQYQKPLYTTVDEYLRLAADGSSLFEVAIRYEVNRSGKTPDEITKLMESQLAVMRRAIKKGISEQITLLSGLASGNDGKLMAKHAATGRTISGDVIPTAISRALAIMEVNGSMGVVVAAPTAGSCGIVPGSLLTLKDKMDLKDDDIVRGLIVASGLGVNYAHADVSFSGGTGGCQGEVGISSALAAAGLVEMVGGSPSQVVHAASIAIKNILGLICDPIGPIEVPCIKRNAIGVANAFASAEMALAGIESAVPADEVILALKNVQTLLPPELRSLEIGGLACTPTAAKYRCSIGLGK